LDFGQGIKSQKSLKSERFEIKMKNQNNKNSNQDLKFFETIPITYSSDVRPWSWTLTPVHGSTSLD